MSWKFLNKKKVSDERILCVIDKPIITEKSTINGEHNKYTFKVAMDASKHEIKVAVESVFNAKVKSVNTSIVNGKEKRFRGIVGKRPSWKKAVVTLEKNSKSIDIGSGA